MTPAASGGVRAVGVDVGERRIGLAVSDRTGTLASPLAVVDRRSGDDAAWRAVAAHVAEAEAEIVVVGLPRSLDGREGAAAAKARADAEAIGAATGLPVELVDERFTTVTAASSMRAAGVRAREQRGRIDAAAAAVLLQSWLDGRRAALR